jgi:hypothetical protein
MEGISGAKTEPNYGEFNNWLLRVNGETGDIIWSKVIGGGSAGEDPCQVKVLNDEILMFAPSYSGVSGLRTLPRKGMKDIWFVKLDGNGIIQSQKCYGGNAYEFSASFTLIQDNILLLVNSNSNASIDKTEDSRGGIDNWFLKLDAEGNILAQKTIGGSNDEYGAGISILPNGNYLISSGSNSGISGDKTTVLNSISNYDTWIIELDAITLDVENTIEQKNNFLIYPNPSFNECNISFDEPVDLRNVILYDNSGRVALQKEYQTGKKTNYILNVSGLAKGIYTLILKGSDFNKTHQLVVE